MALDVAEEVAAMQQMTVVELKDKYAEAFAESARSGNRSWLIKRIVWRLQANAEGDLSQRARRRALELANDADLRLRTPASWFTPQRVKVVHGPRNRDRRLPEPGTVLLRPYKGRTLEVRVLAFGFEFEGKLYRSLSAVAREVTGAHWNGFLFFGLLQKGADA